MLVFNLFKVLALKSSSVCLRTQSKLNVKRHFSLHQNVVHFRKSNSNLNKHYDECIKNGLSPATIFENEWLFQMNLNQLSNGFKLLRKWNPKCMDDLFVLLQLPIIKLAFYTRKTIAESSIVPYGNRVYYFAENFEKNPQDVCDRMIHHKFLFTRAFSSLHQIYQILIENGVNKDDVWKDTWVFMYSIELINRRISLTKKANIETKPWMLRCKPEVFERTIKIKQENRVVLNKDSTAQYLAKRLKVSESMMHIITTKYPTILRVNPTKLKEILDYLFKEGYRPYHILSTPRVLTHSISTLQERLNEMRDLGSEPTLTVLCKNKTTYQELVNTLILKNIESLNNT